MKKQMHRKNGQAMTEYIIIVAVVALAAIAIFSIFSDTLRGKMAGAVKELDGTSSQNSTAADTAMQTKSQDYLKNLTKDGAGNNP